LDRHERATKALELSKLIQEKEAELDALLGGELAPRRGRPRKQNGVDQPQTHQAET
jgi:hypothetical protein